MPAVYRPLVWSLYEFFSSAKNRRRCLAGLRRRLTRIHKKYVRYAWNPNVRFNGRRFRSQRRARTQYMNTQRHEHSAVWAAQRMARLAACQKSAKAKQTLYVVLYMNILQDCRSPGKQYGGECSAKHITFSRWVLGLRALLNYTSCTMP